MKGGKVLTKKQKIFIKEKGLNPDNWLVCKNTSSELVLEHRHTGKYRVIKKVTA